MQKKIYRRLSQIGLALTFTLSNAHDSNADDSRIWASQCFQCHGTNGYPVGDMDEIGGKDPNSLYEGLIEMKYRGKTEGIMDLHARGYSDEQLRAIAEYISVQSGSEQPGEEESQEEEREEEQEKKD
ncbi:MAG: c-type cytochrome [Arenicellales bacterium]